VNAANRSDRCVYFTASPAERATLKIVRDFNSLTDLLNMIRAINAENVHPAQRNRLHLVHSDRQVFYWGHANGLVSNYEFDLYYGRMQRK
jgi:hypothetical protein